MTARREREGEGKRDGTVSADSCLSQRPAGCVLAPSDCWKHPPEPSSLKAFKGNTLTAYFCSFFFSPSSPPQSPISPLLATSLRPIRAPVIHEFISGTAQSCRAHARLCVSDVHGGLSDIRRQDAVGGGGR